jgi:hypothetical protein
MASGITSLAVSPEAQATATKPQPALSPILFTATPISHRQATQSAPPPCRSSDLDLDAGQPVSEPTGQHTVSVMLTNRSMQPCSLFGYPQVTLLDASGQALPFEYRHQGDQVVTSAAPKQFELPPGAGAYVTINKYRCDLGDQSLARTLVLFLPGDRTSLSMSLRSSSGVFGFCGPNDPGSIVSISPLEETFRATLSH